MYIFGTIFVASHQNCLLFSKDAVQILHASLCNLYNFPFTFCFNVSRRFFAVVVFRFFAFPNVSVSKQFFQIFPSNFPHFCLCIFVHCFVCLTALPRLPDVTNFHCPFPLQQQPFVFVLFPHFRFLCFQQVLTQAFASFIDQVALT